MSVPFSSSCLWSYDEKTALDCYDIFVSGMFSKTKIRNSISYPVFTTPSS